MDSIVCQDPLLCQHLLTSENLALCTQSHHSECYHMAACLCYPTSITDGNCVSNRDGTHPCIPTLLVSESRGIGNFDGTFTQFQTRLSHRALGGVGTLSRLHRLTYRNGVSPEEILAYIYAVLYSPIYPRTVL